MIKLIDKYTAAKFITSRHYSPVMPRLTKHYCGYFIEDVLQGVLTFGWGTRPKHTIQKLFPKLDTKDYYEIGKMCMDDSMGKNSETQMLSCVLKWLKENTDIKVLMSGEGADELFCGYLYFHYAPTPAHLHSESIRLVKELHKYDVLRADRCVSSHGLELRVPFLDNDLLDLSFCLDGKIKMPVNGFEKDLIRSSFPDRYLPNSVLWRRKDGMSDGVSGNKGKRWYEEIQDRVEVLVHANELTEKFYSKEAVYYKNIYDTYFPFYQPVIDYWLPKWVDCNGDPSGRIMKIFEEN